MESATSLVAIGKEKDLKLYAPALVFAVGWLFLYGPVYLDFSQVEWRREENGHIPFIMAICLGAAWARITDEAFDFRATGTDFLIGLGFLTLGFLLFSIGRISEATLLVSLSQAIVALSAAICVFGIRGSLKLWFPLVMCFYLIIWPGWMLNALTAPLKQAISEFVSNGLYFAGLPVAHSGAVITAGQYQLLVADACVGLNSLISLSAVGAVYLYVVKRASLTVNIIVMLSILPIAIAANIIRVAMLVLLTYFLGYDVGQGFLHHAAGLLMFAVALMMVFVVDAIAFRRQGRSI